ncbi:MAG: glycosyl transferase family 2, partial [Alistipes sp.]|nr:glycosyl transferase family 2 [Alistipes sp.]
DDFWSDDEKLQLQVAELEKDRKVGLCYSRSKRFYEGAKEEWSYPRGEMYCDFGRLLFDNTVDNVTALARRDMVLQYYREVCPEQHPEWLTDDQPMWLWVAAKSRVVALERVTAAHRLLKESQSQSQNYLKRIAFCDSLMDISVWMDLAVGDGSRVDGLLRKRMEVALWVLSRDGSTVEYVKRWWRDVCRTPMLLFNLAGYGLLVKRWLRKIKRK